MVPPVGDERVEAQHHGQVQGQGPGHQVDGQLEGEAVALEHRTDLAQPLGRSPSGPTRTSLGHGFRWFGDRLDQPARSNDLAAGGSARTANRSATTSSDEASASHGLPLDGPNPALRSSGPVPPLSLGIPLPPPRHTGNGTSGQPADDGSAGPPQGNSGSLDARTVGPRPVEAAFGISRIGGIGVRTWFDADWSDHPSDDLDLGELHEVLAAPTRRRRSAWRPPSRTSPRAHRCDPGRPRRTTTPERRAVVVLAVVAGLASMLAPAYPVGFGLIDPLLRFGFAYVVTAGRGPGPSLDLDRAGGGRRRAGSRRGVVRGRAGRVGALAGGGLHPSSPPHRSHHRLAGRAHPDAGRALRLHRAVGAVRVGGGDPGAGVGLPGGVAAVPRADAHGGHRRGAGGAGRVGRVRPGGVDLVPRPVQRIRRRPAAAWRPSARAAVSRRRCCWPTPRTRWATPTTCSAAGGRCPPIWSRSCPSSSTPCPAPRTRATTWPPPARWWPPRPTTTSCATCRARST